MSIQPSEELASRPRRATVASIRVALHDQITYEENLLMAAEEANDGVDILVASARLEAYRQALRFTYNEEV